MNPESFLEKVSSLKKSDDYRIHNEAREHPLGLLRSTFRLYPSGLSRVLEERSREMLHPQKTATALGLLLPILGFVNCSTQLFSTEDVFDCCQVV